MSNERLKVSMDKIGAFLVVAPPFMGLTSGIVDAILMVLGFIMIAFSKRMIRVPNYLIIWASVFSSFCLISYYWSTVTTTVITTTLSFVQVAIMLFAIVLFCEKKDDLLFLLKCMIFGGVVFSCYYLITNSIFNRSLDYRLAGSNDISIRLMMLSVLIFVFRDELGLKIRSFIVVLLFVFVSFLQGSRKGLIILILGLILDYTLEKRKTKNISYKMKGLLIVAFLLLFVYFICMHTALYNTIGIRLEDTFAFLKEGTAVDASTRDRNLLIEDGIRIWKSNPIVGVGQDNFRYVNSVRYGFYSHNNFIELLANLGMIGFTLYYYIYYYGIRKSYHYIRLRKTETTIAPIIVFIVFLIIDYMSVSYSSESCFVFLGIAFSCLELQNKEDFINQE